MLAQREMAGVDLVLSSGLSGMVLSEAGSSSRFPPFSTSRRPLTSHDAKPATLPGLLHRRETATVRLISMQQRDGRLEIE